MTNFPRVLLSTVMVLCLLSPGPVFSDDDLFARLNDSRTGSNSVVEKIIRGDLILLKSGKKIRLIGLKPPEPPKRPRVEYDTRGQVIEREDPVSTIEERAWAFTRQLLEGKTVRLEYDEQKTDEDFYTLAYVFLVEDKTFVNAEILRQGWADLQIRPPNFKYAEDLRAAYREARREKRGLQGE